MEIGRLAINAQTGYPQYMSKRRFFALLALLLLLAPSADAARRRRKPPQTPAIWVKLKEPLKRLFNSTIMPL